MKILLINGSPHKDGNTFVALNELKNEFDKYNAEAEIIQIGNQAIRGCMACGKCREIGKCVFEDIVNEVAKKFQNAQGIIVASPVYYANANGTLMSFLQRLFFSTPFDKSMKVGASVAIARRGGCSATFDSLNKFYTISNMPIVSSQYWNSVHGAIKGEAKEDLEGLQTMRTLAKNMIFLINSIELEKEKNGIPKKEELIKTNFIR